MSGSLSRAAAALLRWGRGAGGGGLRGPGVRTAGSGGGGGSSAEQLDALVKKDKVVVFLKGTPEQPQCGFSNAVVQILRLHGVRNYAAYNVLDDPQLRQGQGPPGEGRRAEAARRGWGIKDYSNWPTIPQVYLNGEFVGGCDILLQMHQNGDLVEELKKLGIRSALLDEKKDQDSK
ncbi:glutaredoxin-related protein 5, mitochondrial isoform X1 [Mirounga angustirostris]|uniref:glutaredoxin-related protein 5, mitochondrial isoform X1 n=1 Tax=Mirounga angustirostris TaxID=9716 RepID=UPI00313C52D7